MDPQKYIDIEENLSLKLMKAWRKPAQKLYAQMLGKVGEADFDGARKLVEEIDLTEVGLNNKGVIRSHLYAAAMFGARVAASGKKPMMSVGKYDMTMKHVTGLFCRTLEWNATVYTIKAALQSVAQAEGAYKKSEAPVQKAEGKKRFVKEFQSFQKNGDDMLQLVSALHTNRLATWGFTGEAELRGIKTYQLQAVLDGRTSEFCEMIHGKTFQVEEARSTVVQVLSLDNPDDAKQITPWPKQSKTAMSNYKTMSPEDLTALNLHIPPFHPGCRTILVLVGEAVVPVLTGDKGLQTFVEAKQTQEFFNEAGYLSSDARGGGQNKVLKKMIEMSGGAGLPSIVSKAKMDALIKDGNVEMFRGVKGGWDTSAEAYQKQFLEGDYFVGRGIFGDGTYAATTHQGRDALTTAREYSDQSDGSVVRMTFKPGTKVGTYEDIREEAIKEFDALEAKLDAQIKAIEDKARDDGLTYEEFLEKAKPLKVLQNKYYDLSSDVAYYATLKGYHAYIVRETGYMVILHRSSLITEELGGYP